MHPLFDNQRLGFPPNRSMEVLYYNQTWLEELGFSGPPTTPEEFKEMACAAAEANGDGTGGYILRDDASAMASWTYAFGGDILTEDGTGYVLNGPADRRSHDLPQGFVRRRLRLLLHRRLPEHRVCRPQRRSLPRVPARAFPSMPATLPPSPKSRAASRMCGASPPFRTPPPTRCRTSMAAT